MRPSTLEVLLPLVPSAPGRSAPGPAARGEASLRDVEQRLGPFQIGGRAFVVVLHLKQFLPVPADRSPETALAALDSSG